MDLISKSANRVCFWFVGTIVVQPRCYYTIFHYYMYKHCLTMGQQDHITGFPYRVCFCTRVGIKKVGRNNFKQISQNSFEKKWVQVDGMRTIKGQIGILRENDNFLTDECQWARGLNRKKILFQCKIRKNNYHLSKIPRLIRVQVLFTVKQR